MTAYPFGIGSKLDFQKSDDDGREQKVEHHLEKEVSTDKTKQGVSGGIFKARTAAPRGDRLPEEQAASDKEDARVYDRAHNGGR